MNPSLKKKSPATLKSVRPTKFQNFTIGGGYVTDGYIQRDSGVRIIRDGIVIYEGKLASLKRFKDDVKQVKSGFECGLMVEKYNDIKEGDQLEAFIMEEVPQD